MRALRLAACPRFLLAAVELLVYYNLRPAHAEERTGRKDLRVVEITSEASPASLRRSDVRRFQVISADGEQRGNTEGEDSNPGLLTAEIPVDLPQGAARSGDDYTVEVRGRASIKDGQVSVTNLKAVKVQVAESPDDQDDSQQVMHLVEKPQGDPREYQFAQLHNDLEVLNIWDGRATTASFAVAVTAGQFYDPPGFLGLAHLCEHILFLGTKRYPEKTGFDEFLARNGGSTNAFTESEVTVYYASLSHGAVEEGLDRFADFFRAPLLNSSSVWDEVRAVNSEHSKNRNSAYWQTERVMLSLANPANPVELFHTGSEDTLSVGGEEELGYALDVYFKQNYCPPRMKVVTFSRDTLDVQLAMVRDKFGSITASDQCNSTPRSFATPAPFPPGRLGLWVHVQGTAPTPKIWLLFPMDSISPWFRSQPFAYISHVLSYQGEGSLLLALRNELSLVENLSVSADTSSAGTLVWITADLTPSGHSNAIVVLDVIFAYLALLQREGISEKLLQSLVDAQKLEWNWQAPMDAEKATQNFAEAMTRMPPEELLTGDGQIEEPSVEHVNQTLSKIAPGNMNIGMIDVHARDSWNLSTKVRTVPHYGVKYALFSLAEKAPGRIEEWTQWLKGRAGTEDVDSGKEDVDAVLLARLQIIDPSRTELPKLQVPGPINGIPRNVSLDHVTAQHGSGLIGELYGEIPELIDGEDADSSSQLWYREGWTFSQPKVYSELVTRTRLGPGSLPVEVSAHEALLLDLGVQLLEEEMSQRLADLEHIGSWWSVSITPVGATIALGGYAQSVPNVSGRILAEIARGPRPCKKQFQRVLARVKKSLQYLGGSPLKTALSDINILLSPRRHSGEELVNAMSTMEGANQTSILEAARTAVNISWHRPVSLTSMIMGDVDEAGAKQLYEGLLVGLRSVGLDAAVPADEVERMSRVVKPNQPVEIRRMNPWAGDGNHITVLQLLAGVANVERRVMLGMIGHILDEVAFNELRTRQGLGYVSGAAIDTLSNVMMVSCYVQGDKMLPDKVEMQCERVLGQLVPARLRSMTGADFNALKASYKAGLITPPGSSEDEFEHFMNPILLGGCANLRVALLNFLEKGVLSKDQLLEAWEDVIMPKDANRTKVCVKYFGHGESNRPPEPPSQLQFGELARQAGLNTSAVILLTMERGMTLQLQAATSVARAKLLKDGDFWPTELSCDMPTGQEASGSSPHPEAALLQDVETFTSTLSDRSRADSEDTQDVKAQWRPAMSERLFEPPQATGLVSEPIGLMRKEQRVGRRGAGAEEDLAVAGGPMHGHQ